MGCKKLEHNLAGNMRRSHRLQWPRCFCDVTRLDAKVQDMSCGVEASSHHQMHKEKGEIDEFCGVHVRCLVEIERSIEPSTMVTRPPQGIYTDTTAMRLAMGVIVRYPCVQGGGPSQSPMELPGQLPCHDQGGHDSAASAAAACSVIEFHSCPTSLSLSSLWISESALLELCSGVSRLFWCSPFTACPSPLDSSRQELL